jgi:hypothetical protein
VASIYAANGDRSVSAEATLELAKPGELVRVPLTDGDAPATFLGWVQDVE